MKIIAALMLEYGHLDCHGSVEFGAALSKSGDSEQRAESSKRQVRQVVGSKELQQLASGTNKVVRDFEQRHQ